MKNRFNCKITDHENKEIHNKDYKTLQEISNDLGLTKSMVYDLSSRKRDLKYTKFKYYPKIEINKISDNNNEQPEPTTD